MTETVRKMERQTRQATFRPGTVDLEARTVEVVWTTGAPVMRMDIFTGERFWEELSLDPSAVDLSRLNSGAPLLDSHQAFELANVIGVSERAWIDGDEGRALLRFSKRDDVEPYFQDVVDGIIRNVSVGYDVSEYEELPVLRGNLAVFRATNWMPAELSMVPIGADAMAGTRAAKTTHECRFINQAKTAEMRSHPMEDEIIAAVEETTAEVVAPVIVEVTADTERAVATERKRSFEITTLARKAGIDDKTTDAMIKRGISLEAARNEVLDHMFENAGKIEIRGHATPKGEDAAELRMRGIEECLLHQANPGKHKLTDNGRRWAGMRLMEIGRTCLEEAGIDTRGKSQDQIAGMALGNVAMKRAGMHTTSDFPNVLQAVAQKTLREAYERAPQTFKQVFRRGTLPDFRPTYRNQLGDMDTMEKVNEHGEFKYGTFGDSKEIVQLATYGKIFAFTRQMMINDDLNFLSRLPEMFGYRAADLESDITWGIVTSNPVMSDGNAYFSSAHGNLAAVSGAPSIATLGAMRAALRVQRASTGGGFLNLVPRFAVIPTTLETVFDQLLTSTTPQVSGDVTPAYIRSLQVIVEPRLDANSATAWYLFADPGMIDTIEYDYLNGQEGLYTETREGWEVDGLQWKARMDFGAAAIDWRGAQKNNG